MPRINKSNVNNSLIKRLRFHANLNQSKLASMLGVTQTLVSYWESYTQAPAKRLHDKILKIAAKFDFEMTIKSLEKEFKRG
jgi:DNA-binding transcriptional regulator YiaG